MVQNQYCLESRVSMEKSVVVDRNATIVKGIVNANRIIMMRVDIVDQLVSLYYCV